MEQVKAMMMMDMKESIPLEPITTTTCPTWKLYENPFYNSHHHHHQTRKHIHQLHLPLSARKISASFWDLTFLKPIMETELDFARAQILELKAELDYERKARKKWETMSKRLAKQLAEETRGREALERVCEQLAKEVSIDKAEIGRMKREIEEERKMLRMSEVLREERVQMKLAEAKIIFEEKLLQLQASKDSADEQDQELEQKNNKSQDNDHKTTPVIAIASKTASNLSGKFNRLFLRQSCDDSSCTGSVESTRTVLRGKYLGNDNLSSVSSITNQRRASPEAENPHIKRGIKGFVEFPRVVRAIGSKSRHWGTKVECQKAQLRILLRQRSPIRSNSLILS